MATQVHCDQFRKGQFVPARRVRAIYTVYIASREERNANRGLGCLVKDRLTGKEQRLKVSDLMKMHLRYLNGKKVQSFLLKGGFTYTMQGMPAQADYGVFIVPRGQRYEYKNGEESLVSGTCIIWDGSEMSFICYSQFRKSFCMLPNPVSTGRLRGSKSMDIDARTEQASVRSPNIGFNQQETITQIPKQASAQVFHQTQQHESVQPPQVSSQVGFTAVARIYQGTDFIGLVLTDGLQQIQVPLARCIEEASVGKIMNVKSVTRKGTTFLMGNGISLGMLPVVQVM